jgi:hypothetical protein
VIRWRPHPAGALIAALVVLLCPLGSPDDAQGRAGVAESPSRAVPQAPYEVRGYWTPARMRAARPAELRHGTSGRLRSRGSGGDPAAPSGIQPTRAADVSAESAAFPGRVHGKVFFTIDGGSSPGDYVCSGTVVASNGHTLAWTAGHCVNDAEFGGGFATNWTFVPAYQDGAQPFGSWPAEQLFTTEGWRRHANIRVDLGAARLARDAQGRGIEDVIGARGIAFNRDREQTIEAFGYPAQPTLLRPEFNGEHLYACESPLSGRDQPPGEGPPTLQINCDMSGGSSGGGWVVGAGLVGSVTSYVASLDLFHLYGPYQGSIAEGLYRAAGGRALTCAGRAVTNLGGAGPDAFSGASGGDSFRLAGDADSVLGRGGADRACGGSGADELNGEAGADRLHGGGGRDLLIGGPGRDLCDGGPGRDRARGCELRLRIP